MPKKSEKEDCVTFQFPLLTKSNNLAWMLKMCVNLQAQGMQNVVGHADDVKKCKDSDNATLILSPMIQAFVEARTFESKKLTPLYTKFGSTKR